MTHPDTNFYLNQSKEKTKKNNVTGFNLVKLSSNCHKGKSPAIQELCVVLDFRGEKSSDKSYVCSYASLILGRDEPSVV